MKRRRPSPDFKRAWEIGLGRTAFQKLSAQEPFQCLIALARLMNLLRFAQGAVMGMTGHESPFAKRQTLNSFCLSCAVLYEAYQNVLPPVGRHFAKSTAYLNGLGAWRSRPEVRDLIENHCRPLRASATFHVDIDPMADRLRRVSSDWNRILSCVGTLNVSYYYDIADMVALLAFWGDLESAADALAHAEDLSRRATEVAVGFLGAADALIASVISEPPFRLRQLPDMREPEWVAREIEKELRARRQGA